MKIRYFIFTAILFVTHNTYALVATICSPKNNSCSHCDVTYSCNTGYYGTSNTTGTSGCTKCPSNATCAGGNSSTFTCNSGYYKTSTGCVKCPANATCDGSKRTFICDQYYYPSPNTTSPTSCAKCPDPGTNGGPNDDADIENCFLYKITNDKRYYDAVGDFNVTGNCPYSLTESPKYQVLGIH